MGASGLGYPGEPGLSDSDSGGLSELTWPPASNEARESEVAQPTAPARGTEGLGTDPVLTRMAR
jgi:hypothetical protein